MDMDDNFENILAEMRGNEFDDPAFDGESIVAVRRLARSWANRLELTVKQKVSSAYNRGCREYGKVPVGEDSVCHHNLCQNRGFDRGQVLNGTRRGNK